MLNSTLYGASLVYFATCHCLLCGDSVESCECIDSLPVDTAYAPVDSDDDWTIDTDTFRR